MRHAPLLKFFQLEVLLDCPTTLAWQILQRENDTSDISAPFFCAKVKRPQLPHVFGVSKNCSTYASSTRPRLLPVFWSTQTHTLFLATPVLIQKLDTTLPRRSLNEQSQVPNLARVQIRYSRDL